MLFFVFIAVVVFAVFFFFKGSSFLSGNGLGFIPGNDNQKTVSRTSEVKEGKDNNTDEDIEEIEEIIPNEIIVSIKEDKVMINGYPVENSDELREYVEKYNSDSRTFKLEEEQSILETYNWVKNVFKTLDIALKNSNE